MQAARRRHVERRLPCNEQSAICEFCAQVYEAWDKLHAQIRMVKESGDCIKIPD